MSRDRFFCQNARRRAAVRFALDAGVPRLNGIDYLEVLSEDQTQLGLYFVHGAPTTLTPTNFLIEGGVRVQNLRVESVSAMPDDPDGLVLAVNQPGDFSTYQLRIVTTASNPAPPADLEPPLDAQLAAVAFSFKVNCPNPFDCPQPPDCPPESLPAPQIDYLAKDYASFRQLMLDRLAVTLPAWRERNPADLGIALVETLAYAADYVSYYQDAVATEAYLGTARQRASVRRHTRLLGYPLHEGCNSRTWVQVQVDDRGAIAAQTPLLTRVAGLSLTLEPGTPDYRNALRQATGFETLHEQALFPSHNEIRFYTWCDDNCCLPRGATGATLLSGENDAKLQLQVGDVLILEEVISPETGAAADAELRHRHAVRLTRVTAPVTLPDTAIAALTDIPEAVRTVISDLFDTADAADPEAVVSFASTFELVDTLRRELAQTDLEAALTDGLISQLFAATAPVLRDPLTGDYIAEVAWHEEDALPFSLCISKTIDDRLVENLTVARGNLVLADHGLTQQEPAASAASPESALLPPVVEDFERYRPRLRFGPVTHRVPYIAAIARTQSAQATRQQDPRAALAAMSLTADEETWEVRRDLLNSDRFDRGLVVEMDDRRTARLRFGDGVLGRRPSLGTRFRATYRLGNGPAGNVGADAISHLVTTEELPMVALRNPLPAIGGTAPEPAMQAKLDAPQAFRVQQRAVTAADYAAIAQRHPQVQKAQATRRWTGSWYTWFLTIDRRGGLPVDAEFEAELRQFLASFRLAGYDLEVDAPRFVPLDIAFSVCVRSGYYPRAVEAALLEQFSAGTLPNGQKGFFHPDNFTFGQAVYLSQIVATAMAVPGVQWVDFNPENADHRFQRWGRSANQELENGEITMERLEIARLDNDRNAPENGQLQFLMEGGR